MAGENTAKRTKISGFEKPPVLKTFQSGGAARNLTQRDDASGHVMTELGGITRPGNVYSSMTSLKQAAGRPASPATSERTTGSPGFPDKLRTSELYQKRAAKSDKPTGLDDTILKRLVINGRKMTSAEDDGYCSNAPSGDSNRDLDTDGPVISPAGKTGEFPYPPPPSSTSSPRDMRLCSEPPVSPYTKMSSVPPFTYQEISTAPRPPPSPSLSTDPYSSNSSSMPKYLTSGQPFFSSGASQPSRNAASTFGGGSVWQQRPPLLAGRSSPSSAKAGPVVNSLPGRRSSPKSGRANSPWRPPYSSGIPTTTATTRSPSPFSSTTKANDTTMEMMLRQLPGHRDIFNDSLEMAEDCNTTTTSGSYAVDEEDLSVDLSPANNVYV
ncbi:hypothetical protein ElyMa_002466700 [Elysia marginata]|uniref:WH2 domain-containing protein n=1 Tax=Elysia marginata TaxID=1093978 RepID=A0AAV4GKV8_9GAST|nr:hypothetical protein ElyMa_002466700 [Elysia marginata]